MSAHQIGLVPFVDGITRAVFLGEDGHEGQAAHGEWFHIDEPLIVEVQ